MMAGLSAGFILAFVLFSKFFPVISIWEMEKEDKRKRRIKMKRWLLVIIFGSLFFLYSFNLVLGQASKPPKKTPEFVKPRQKTLRTKLCNLPWH